MPKNRRSQFQYPDQIKMPELDSIQHGQYLYSTSSIFSIMETLLRIAIRTLGKRRGVNAASLKQAADQEQQFNQLVLYFDLIYPQNGLREKLIKFNQDRNMMTHQILHETKESENLQLEVNAFCRRGVWLNNQLRKLLNIG